MPTDRRPARRAALLSALDRSQLDGIVLTHLPNVRYLTGFTGTAGVVAVLPRETVLLTDFRYRTQAEEEIGDVARLEIVASDVWQRLWEILGNDSDVQVLGFESHALSVEDRARFDRSGLPKKFVAARHLVEALREQKDDGEIAAIRAAATLAHEALAATLSQVRPGLRELDVAARLEKELRERGSEWHPFPTIVAAGERSALPHATSSARELRSGEWLLLDFGARVDGYCADVTRTVLVGTQPDDRQRTVYDMVQAAQRAARDHMHAGMTGSEADAIARSLIETRGFGDAFGHSLGHGLGLEVHEAPRVSKTNDDALPERAVVTVEPGVYIVGWGGVRIEDDVLLTAEGVELLSDGETDLMVVGD